MGCALRREMCKRGFDARNVGFRFARIGGIWPDLSRMRIWAVKYGVQGSVWMQRLRRPRPYVNSFDMMFLVWSKMTG